MSHDVTITPLETQALFDLRGPATVLRDWAGDSLPAFPQRPNTGSSNGRATLMFLGPDHWILRADLAREDAFEAALRPVAAPPEISIVRISDTLAFFRIIGPEAGEILSIACPLDLHPRCFGHDAASFTAAFGIKALVIRCEGGFELAVDRSYLPMMTECLTAAAG
ncbi:MAG: sarcosine oxidase subunit gamma [Rhodobacteraceae bacterium]|nr:sarcosine oxidase subunit gamma [Paracoccaceae bacterium]